MSRLAAQYRKPTGLQAIGATALGTAVVAGAAWLSVAFWDGTRPWSPASLPAILPMLMMDADGLAEVDGAVLAARWGAALFLALGVPLVVPRWWMVVPGVLCWGLLVPGSAVYFWQHWSAGVEHQGAVYTVALAGINAACAAGTGWLAAAALERRRSYARRFAFTLVLCTWLVWFAFPWLGKLPGDLGEATDESVSRWPGLAFRARDTDS